LDFFPQTPFRRTRKLNSSSSSLPLIRGNCPPHHTITNICCGTPCKGGSPEGAGVCQHKVLFYYFLINLIKHLRKSYRDITQHFSI
jgi:hypothetical protein